MEIAKKRTADKGRLVKWAVSKSNRIEVLTDYKQAMNRYSFLMVE
jgi:hypothetical protein